MELIEIEDVAQGQAEYPRFKPTTLPLAALRGATLGLFAGAIWAYIIGGRIDPDWGHAFTAWFAHIVSGLLHPLPGAWPYISHAVPILQSSLDSWNAGISSNAAWTTWILESQHIAFSIVFHGSIYGALLFTFFSAVRWLPSILGSEFMERTAAEYRAINLSTTRFWRLARGLFGIALAVFCVICFALFNSHLMLGGLLGPAFLTLSFMTIALFATFWIFYPTAWARVVKIFGFPIYLPMHIFAAMIDNQDKDLLKLLNLLVYGHTGESDKPNVEHLRGAAVLSGDDLAKIIRQRSQ